jgi:hypothetical protein
MRRHPTRRSGRLFFLPLSVLALLAFACFPVFAQAETGIPEYETEVPTVKGHTNPPSDKAKNNERAESSTEEGSAQGGAVPGGTGSGSGSSGGPSSEKGNPSMGKDRSTGQGSQGNGTTAKPQAGSIAAREQVGGPTEDDGSSPLVPILIAIAALAAISIGAVMLRQRRQGDEEHDPVAPASPKAS